VKATKVEKQLNIVENTDGAKECATIQQLKKLFDHK
jgi:hypothetical protein